MRLKNKVAIVTGGAQGIGKAICELFAKEGATVYIWDILDKAKEVVDTINKNGGNATFTKLSITDKSSVESNAKKIYDEHGRLDILINNAGVLRDKSLLKMSDEDWDTSISVNLKGTFLCTRACVQYMKTNSYGRIINASSTSGMRGNFGQTNYAATKIGVVSMAKTWALEFGKYGITANAIAPGATDTEMMASVPQEVKQTMISYVPAKRMAKPIEIAYGYLYLASEEAGYVNGVLLNIDGGFAR